MPYIVNNTDSSLTVTIADGVVDTTSYSLALVGRNVSNYGQYFAQNTIRQMENFASETPPSVTTPLTGQLWYDKSENLFRVYDGSIWKRATNITVGNDGQKPSGSFGSGGAAFYNTTVDKLQIHNGSTWKDAGYAGYVTSAYSTDPTDGSPTDFGSRIRNIFLTDTTGRKHPVLAISYVKTTTAGGQNAGTTTIDGQSETIMALHSDSEFTISSTVAPIVDGVSVPGIYTELTASTGIAGARTGRSAGVIKAGMNVRYEYEQNAVTHVDELYATTIGSSADKVSDIFTEDLFADSLTSSDINVVETGTIAALDVTTTLDVGGNTDLIGAVTLGSDLSAVTGNVTFSDLTVSTDTRLNGNTSLNGNTEINGNLTVNGVLTQTLGTVSDRIEDYYGDDATITNVTIATGSITTLTGVSTASIQNLTVGANADVTGAVNVTGDIISDASVIGGVLTDGTASLNSGSLSGAVNGTFSGAITADSFTDGTATLTSGALSGATNGTFSGTVTADILTDGALSITDGDITGGADAAFSGTVSATEFDGVATSAQYADLAEVYASDELYTPGTVVKLGGEQEITQTTDQGDTEVFGVISTDPAYLMNSKAQGQPVAMTGRIPVRVTGAVQKGERLISSSIPGVAQALGTAEYDPRKIIGRALDQKTDDTIGLIEAVVGVK